MDTKDLKKLLKNKIFLLAGGFGVVILLLIIVVFILFKSVGSTYEAKTESTKAVSNQTNTLATINDKDGDGIPNSVDQFPEDHDND